MKTNGKKLEICLSKSANKNRFNVVTQTQKRIDKGAAWLDEVRPVWVNIIQERLKCLH